LYESCWLLCFKTQKLTCIFLVCAYIQMRSLTWQETLWDQSNILWVWRVGKRASIQYGSRCTLVWICCGSNPFVGGSFERWSLLVYVNKCLLPQVQRATWLMVISILLWQCRAHSSAYGRSGGHLQSLSKRYHSDATSGKCNDEIWKAIFLPNLTRLAATFMWESMTNNNASNKYVFVIYHIVYIPTY
jgi:hypothetical protein